MASKIQVKAGNVCIGGGAQVSVQSMLNVPSTDIEGSVNQAKKLEAAGCQIIRAAIPEAQERVSWSMPTFWKGRNLIHFAANKKHIGLYPGDEAVAAFADRLEAFDTSKGTIRLPHAEPLPLGLIEDIARWCMEKYGQ